jgi:hypothetical protein
MTTESYRRNYDGTTAAIKDRRLFYEARFRVEYTAKHHGRLAAIALSMFIVIFELPISPREGWVVLRGTPCSGKISQAFLALIANSVRDLWASPTARIEIRHIQVM